MNRDQLENSDDRMIRLALALEDPAARIRKKRDEVIGTDVSTISLASMGSLGGLPGMGGIGSALGDVAGVITTVIVAHPGVHSPIDTSGLGDNEDDADG